MNNAMFFLIFMSMLNGVFIYKTVEMVWGWVDIYFKDRVFPSLERMNFKESCKLHSWKNMKLVVRGLEPATYKVCSDCGFIFGTKKRLNKPGLEVYRTHQEALRLEGEIFDKALRIRQIKLDLAMNNMIKTFISCDTVKPLQDNIEFMQNFFRKAVIEIDVVNQSIEKVIKDDTDQSKFSE